MISTRCGLTIPLSGINMRKRQKFVITSVILATGVGLSQLSGLDLRYWMIGGMAFLTWVLVAWSLKEGLSGVEWGIVTMPPALFTVATGLFFILLPEARWAQLLIIALFGVGQYALLLSANIFSVAAIRTIALLRAAHAVGFIMTILTGFFLYDTILSSRFWFWLVVAFVAIASFLLILPALWSTELTEKITSRMWKYALVLAGCLGILAGVISFWPINLVVASLFLTTMLYVFLGVSQHHFTQRLFKRTIYEYATVGVVVLITMLVTSLRGG
ncbi:MAG: Uncharacterized protein G01um101416_1164 [Microgenomates group bacterium Gr01-1014_16]|nr:MAG: Uncharacterized protein G01um101416_1164 [Microgenomates group bacterium Gr01-1014_16]